MSVLSKLNVIKGVSAIHFENNLFRWHSHKIKLTILKWTISGIYYIHSVVQLPPLLSSQSKTLYPWIIFTQPHSPSPQQPPVCVLSLHLPILHTSYKWSHMICDLWCLVSFTILDVFELHPWMRSCFWHWSCFYIFVSVKLLLKHACTCSCSSFFSSWLCTLDSWGHVSFCI